MIFTLKAPSTKIIPFEDSVDQDQSAQNMQPDLGSALSAMLEDYMQEI